MTKFADLDLGRNLLSLTTYLLTLNKIKSYIKNSLLIVVHVYTGELKHVEVILVYDDSIKEECSYGDGLRIRSSTTEAIMEAHYVWQHYCEKKENFK